MANHYVDLKTIEGKTFITVGRPDAQFDVLYPIEMAREMKRELDYLLATMPDGNVLKIVK